MAAFADFVKEIMKEGTKCEKVKKEPMRNGWRQIMKK